MKTNPIHLRAWPLALCAALLLVAADADAKGGRRGGSSHSSSSKSHPSSEHEASGSGTTINIRTNSSSSSSNGNPSSASSLRSGTGAMPAGAAAGAGQPTWGTTPLTPEEEARRAAAMTAYERDQAEKLNELKAAEQKREADRLAEEKAAALRAQQKSAEERAAAAKVAAEQDKKRREEAAIAAEADQILQRAKSDYPVLRTAEGQVVLQQILEKQKALQAKGLYPSVAMVEAVADHAHMLAPKIKMPQAAAPAAEAPKTIGGCRWVTPTQWGCS